MELYHQHVFVESMQVSTVDNGGTFLGVLRVPGGPGGNFNLGLALLQAGLAKLHHMFDPSKVSQGQEMETAESKARAARLKVRQQPLAE